MNRKQIEEKVITMLSDELGIEKLQLQVGKKLPMDDRFDVDSLDIIEILMEVEDVFNIELLDLAFPTDITIVRMVSVIQVALEEKNENS